MAIVRPLLISKALNDYVTKAKDIEGLNTVCLMILGLLFVEAFLQILNLRITNLLGQNIVKDLRNQQTLRFLLKAW